MNGPTRTSGSGSRRPLLLFLLGVAWTTLTFGQPPPREPPVAACSAGALRTGYLQFPLDGRVSHMRKVRFLSRPVPGEEGVVRPAVLTRFETVGDRSFFVNEYVVAERDERADSYEAVRSSGIAPLVDEMLDDLELATPNRRYRPERVLLLKVARHRSGSSQALQPRVDVGGPVFLRRSRPDRRGVATPDDPPVSPLAEPERVADGAADGWRFAVEFDVRDALGLERTSQVLWSEHDVPQGWLDRLVNSITVEFDSRQHRVLVYAVVEVEDAALTIRQHATVVPQCCCAEGDGGGPFVEGGVEFCV